MNKDVTLDKGSTTVSDSGALGVFIINASNIVMDCDGSTFTGDGSGAGIYLNGHHNVTLVDCKFENYSYSVYVEGSENNTMTGFNTESAMMFLLFLGF